MSRGKKQRKEERLRNERGEERGQNDEYKNFFKTSWHHKGEYSRIWLN